MLQILKKTLPKPVKEFVVEIKTKTIDSWRKKQLARKILKKHEELVANLQGNEKIKVLFLVIHSSIWKVDNIFKRMQADSYFNVEILICPYVQFGEERMQEEMAQAYDFFKKKGYPVTKAQKEDGAWVKLQQIKPDIVFFTNPHNLTRKEYYEDAYLNYLSCYVPYHHEVTSYGGNIYQYDQMFHNAMWLIFSPHNASFDIYKNINHAKGNNVFVTGYPLLEGLFKNNDKLSHSKVYCKEGAWKNNDKRLRVIWAPHHTIEAGMLPWSNFLQYAEKIKTLAVSKQESIVWSFKPHPILKPKLYDHFDWGKTRTDAFYSFWKEQEFTQLDLGEYESLFEQSDAMIHDSSSFLAEYLYFKKPVLYMMAKNNNLSFFTDFGKKALASSRTASNFMEIETFIDNLAINNIRGITDAHIDFYDNELSVYFQPLLPSEKLIDKIKERIGHD